MTAAMSGLASRRAALDAVRRVEEEGAYSNLVVPDVVAHLDLRDRAFASHLAYETLRWRGTLDWMLMQVVDRPLDQIEPALARILRLGAVQLHRSDVPARAAVATAAELAGRAVPGSRARGATGFVNGVLRALARRVPDLPWPDAGSDPVANLRLTTAHPAWMVTDLLARFDPERVRTILQADNDPPGLTLRATGDRHGLIEELHELGFDANPGSLARESVRVPGADPRVLDAVREGRAVPQDEASMLVVHAAEVRPGERVLDLCAGPGGKATHMAQLGGLVTAVELHPARAELVREAATRLGVEVDVRVGDGTDPPVDGGFDVVLVDAPCTGLGTGRRRPEVRWRRTADDADDLAALQGRLLEAGRRKVLPGGRLVYAACTWTARETIDVVDAFESELAGFRRLTARQLFPDQDGTDGMFVASWRAPGATDVESAGSGSRPR